MLTSDQAPVAFRSDSVELIERGTDTVLRLRPARAGSAITPTSATITITDPAGTVVVNAAVASVATAGQATYTVLGTLTTDLTLGEGWSVTWSVLLPGETVARTVRLAAVLIRARLYSPISDQDLFRRARALDPANSKSRDTAVEDFSPYLDDAWTTILDRLVASGKKYWLIMSPTGLREVHLTLTLAMVYDDLASRNNAAYGERAKELRQQYRDAWADLQLDRYDAADTGSNAGAVPVAASPGGTWLGGRPYNSLRGLQ